MGTRQGIYQEHCIEKCPRQDTETEVQVRKSKLFYMRLLFSILFHASFTSCHYLSSSFHKIYVVTVVTGDSYWATVVHIDLFIQNVLFLMTCFSAPKSRFFTTIYPQPVMLSAGNTFTLPVTFRPLEKITYEDCIDFVTNVSCFFSLQISLLL